MTWEHQRRAIHFDRPLDPSLTRCGKRAHEVIGMTTDVREVTCVGCLRMGRGYADPFGHWCPGCQKTVTLTHWIDSMTVLIRVCMRAARRHECSDPCPCATTPPMYAAHPIHR